MKLLTVFLLLAGSGGAACFCAGNGKNASRIGAAGAVAALLTALVFSLRDFAGMELLGACCRLPIILIGVAAALYAPGYLACHDEGRTGFFWLFFNLTVGAMLAVTEETEPFRFLIAWELMGLFSFFLVGFDLKSRQVMRASWIYLLGCEAGGMALMLAFAAMRQLTPGGYFTLLLLGFGLKAGFPLLHVWLPEAHPAAPAPVSALMSGAMIPLGFCGILRFAPLHGHAGMLALFAWALLILGMIGAFSGILFALGQRDLKRLLAYSSVENIGIMAMGFGIGTLGVFCHSRAMVYCGVFGAMLHLLNHALLKGTLFLCAGTILCSTHSLNMDQMGGLMKKLPLTGTFFTISSFGICGLPPFCGFTGELLIYAAAFAGISRTSGLLFGALIAAVIVLALTGGCACAAFAKAAGAVFQGEPRSEAARNALPEKRGMVWPLPILLLPVLLIPLLPLFFPLEEWINESLGKILHGNAVVTLILYVIGILLLLGKKYCGCDKRRPGTWDCGYARPTARMEYTGSAFVQPAADFFNVLLRQKKQIGRPEGLFPHSVNVEIDTPDYAERGLWRPLFECFGRISEKIHRFQSGYLQLYILMMVIALVLMLLWGYCSGMEGR